jgi:prevent-host-death family protein
MATMDAVGIRELKTHASEILRRVREEKQTIDVTYRGEVVARIVPVAPKRPTGAELADYWAELDQLIADIARQAPPDVTAADVMRDIRREL